jgi:hypothetical protein
MKETTIRTEYEPKDVLGVAELDENQVRNLSFNTQSSRLRKDLTYVIPAQKVHNENVQVNNETRKSLRVFCIGVNDKDEVQVRTSISINTLRQRHYGFVAEGKKLIPAEKNQEGLWRIQSGIRQQSVFANGGLPLVIEGKLGLIKRPMAFRVLDRTEVYQPQFKETAAGSRKFNVVTFHEDGKDYADMAKNPVNIYNEVLEVPKVDAKAVIENFSEYEYSEK